MSSTVARSFSSWADRRQKLLTGALVEGDGVQFVGSDSPPARQSGAADQPRHQLMPDQGLNVFRNDKVLLRLSQHEGQIRERARQMRSAACRQAGTEHVRNMPGLSASHCHFSGEVMGAHIQRIVEKNLSSRRLVIGVIQSHQRVSQEWGDDAAGLR